METNTALSIRQYYKFLILGLGGIGIGARIIPLWNPQWAVTYLLEGLLLLSVFSALTLSRYDLLKNFPKRRDVFPLLGAPGFLFLSFLLMMAIDYWQWT